MTEVAVIFWLVVIVVVPIMLILFKRQQKELGNIRCRRCNHVGPAKGKWAPFRGIRPVCAVCESEDWLKA
jgi:hypothetical protein